MGPRAEFVVRRVMEPINPALIIILGVYTMLWGLWVGNPFWDVFTTATLYDQMAHYPEWAWGAFAFASGAAILVGTKVGSNRALRVGSAIGYFHWMIVAGVYFMGDWRNTGGITAATFCVYSLLVFLNLERNRSLNIKSKP